MSTSLATSSLPSRTIRPSCTLCGSRSSSRHRCDTCSLPYCSDHSCSCKLISAALTMLQLEKSQTPFKTLVVEDEYGAYLTHVGPLAGIVSKRPAYPHGIADHLAPKQYVRRQLAVWKSGVARKQKKFEFGEFSTEILPLVIRGRSTQFLCSCQRLAKVESHPLSKKDADGIFY